MIQHIVVVLTFAMCSTNAALTVNIFDDELTNTVKDVGICEIRSCNRLCHRLQFTDGVCVDGHCKCERKEVKNQELDTSADVLASCNSMTCNRLCRRLGYSGGRCISNRCTCDNSKQALGVDVMDAIPNLDTCSYQSCDQMCRRLGFTGGACVGDRCKCDNFKQATDLLVDQYLGSCYALECDQQCRRIGYPGGVCVNGRCKCDIMQLNEENKVPVADNNEKKQQELVRDIETKVSDVKTKASSDSCACDPRSCDTYCFRLHYTGGICLTGKCRCYK